MIRWTKTYFKGMLMIQYNEEDTDIANSCDVSDHISHVCMQQIQLRFKGIYPRIRWYFDRDSIELGLRLGRNLSTIWNEDSWSICYNLGVIILSKSEGAAASYAIRRDHDFNSITLAEAWNRSTETKYGKIGCKLCRMLPHRSIYRRLQRQNRLHSGRA